MLKEWKKRLRRANGVEIFAWVFFALMSVGFLYPLYMTVILSITSEQSILTDGFRLWPSEFSLQAYELLIKYNGSSIFRAIGLTVVSGLVQPFLSIALTMCLAYPLSQPDFKGRNFWRWFLVLTMLLDGSLVASYLLKAKYLHLRNNVLIYFLPGVGAWNVFLFRTFFVNLDKSMIESAKIDGANNFQILWKIMLPLVLPLVAINYFSGFIGRWNDITTPLYFISDKNLYTIQYLLQQMLTSHERLQEMLDLGMVVDNNLPYIPAESTRYALAAIGALPAFLLLPFIQKYYAKGITLGSTKG